MLVIGTKKATLSGLFNNTTDNLQVFGYRILQTIIVCYR